MSSKNKKNSSNSKGIQVINTVLVANRGEIACRVIATAKRLGMRTVAIYSTADANAMHVAAADVAVCIGAAQPSESYLSSEAVINAALQSGADAIHPGYGFLSENPEFVEACSAEGIVFIGPDAPAMRSMGLKDAAKALMEKAGVPVVPGYHGDNQDASFLSEQAQEIGYPVLIKARAGGGGKGMRKVDCPDDFVASLEAAQREGGASFGDSTVLIEKYIEQPRHIEVQVFGDRHGRCVHLFERDCSLQRRHQKVIEEAPAPGMSDEVRKAMTDAAIRTAESINYVGAGTVEFIVDASGPLRTDGFWFMEMNTRLQVEHPVTEAITGFDLVEWQLLVAAGHPIPVEQEGIKINGHSVEARLYAEDVEAGFLPATGTLHRFVLSDQGRVDTGVMQGDVVQPYYDPMLAKLISHASSREDAFRKLHRMLNTSVVMGVTTNRSFLASLCVHEHVLAGLMHTGLIEEGMDVKAALPLSEHQSVPSEIDGNLALAAIMCANLPQKEPIQAVQNQAIFARLGLWQTWGEPSRQVELLVNQQLVSMTVVRRSVNAWRVNLDSASTTIDVKLTDLNELAHGSTIHIDELVMPAIALFNGDSIYCRIGECETHYMRPVIEQGDSAAAMGAHLISPMPGRIIAVNCTSGDAVSKGDVLVTLEAMKMEHNLIAVEDGQIEGVSVEVGDQVEQGMRLIMFDKT